MYTAKIKKIEKVRHQATGTDFLDVTIALCGSEDRVVTEEDLANDPLLAEQGVQVGETISLPVEVERKHSFDPSISKEDLKAEVQKIVAAFNQEQEQAKAQAELDAIDENVAELQSELEESEITINEQSND